VPLGGTVHLVALCMTATGLVLLDLGEAGRSWVRSSLEQGKELSRAFLAVSDLESTQTWAYVPASRVSDALTNLAWGGIFTPKSAKSAQEFTFRRLQATQGLVIVEDELATPADPFLSRFRGSFAINETDVFHWLALGASSISAELEAFVNSRSSGYPLNAFLVNSSLTSLPEHLSSDFIATLVDSVDAVIVSAWDAESVAVCQVRQ
jgi:hypothetical protein